MVAFTRNNISLLAKKQNNWELVTGTRFEIYQND